MFLYRARSRLYGRLIALDRFGDVVPGREMASLGGQDNDLDLVIVKCAIERIVHGIDHGRVDGVVLFDTDHDNARHAWCGVLIADQLILLGHFNFPQGFSRLFGRPIP